MRTLTTKEQDIFEQLTRMSQAALLRTMSSYLGKKYDIVYTSDNYVYALGTIPVALVAHLDTVFPTPPEEIYYDRAKNVMISPQGLGADDRAGIFAIIKLVQRGLRPSIILCADEETGCIGATAFAMEFQAPMVPTHYLVELDRRGSNDCVFYSCGNTAFMTYIESFGFKLNFGSFSDISAICPAWQIAGANLSIGYENEHTQSETLNFTHFFNTLTKVTQMLQETDIPAFAYEGKPQTFWPSSFWDLPEPVSNKDGYCVCGRCGKSVPNETNLTPVEVGPNYEFWCDECVISGAKECPECGTLIPKDQKKCVFCEGKYEF